MDNVRDLGIERVIGKLRDFLEDPEMDTVSAASLDALRAIIGDILRARYGDGDALQSVAVEVADGRRERIHQIRVPHAHRIRDPHGVDGASLSEAMESLELIMLTASNAVRSVAGEIASQETGREMSARHVAQCAPIRRWGESLSEVHPGLSRMLISFAEEGVIPRIIAAEDARTLGFDPGLFQALLDPSRKGDLTAHLRAMAVESGFG